MQEKKSRPGEKEGDQLRITAKNITGKPRGKTSVVKATKKGHPYAEKTTKERKKEGFICPFGRGERATCVPRDDAYHAEGKKGFSGIAGD